MRSKCTQSTARLLNVLSGKLLPSNEYSVGDPLYGNSNLLSLSPSPTPSCLKQQQYKSLAANQTFEDNQKASFVYSKNDKSLFLEL